MIACKLIALRSLLTVACLTLAVPRVSEAQVQPGGVAGGGAPAGPVPQMAGRQSPTLVGPYPTAPLVTTPEADAAGWADAAKGVRPLERLDVAPLLAEDEANRVAGGKPFRMGIVRQLPGGAITPETAGVWGLAADGTAYWRVRIDAPGAAAIRVNFSRFDLAEGARVVVRGTDATMAPQMYELQGPIWKREFLAGMTPGQTVFIEYQIPADRAKEPPRLVIDEVTHFYRDPLTGRPVGEQGERVLGCHVDVNCRTTDPVAKNSVGVMFFNSGGSGYNCSGALLNNADVNGEPAYFLTANHCLSSQGEVNTLQVAWLYQTSTCNGSVPGTVPFTLGGTLLSTGALPAYPDFTFIRLANDVNQGQGQAGWVADPGAPYNAQIVIGIHHPAGSWKRYAGGAGSPPLNCGLPEPNFSTVQWFGGEGTTEGGSSGSPLFDTAWRVIGQLYGYCPAGADQCNPAAFKDFYGRFGVTYNYISGWLSNVTPDDSHEPNDSFAEAAPTSQGGHTPRLSDFEDYFQFTVSSSTIVRLSASYTESEMDLAMRLYNSSQVLLQTSNGTSGSETINRSVTPGTYYLRFSRTQGWGGSYSFSISEGCGAWAERLTTSPSPRSTGALVFDAARGVSVLFGGAQTDNLAPETWTWNGSLWQRVAVAGPSSRRYPGACYDSVRQRVVLFGGYGGGSNLGDTWEWNGAAWQQMASTGPGARQGAMVAYDSGRQRTVLFGGYDTGYDRQTWEWDGTAWTHVTTSGPSARVQGAMAYDAARGETVLFGGDGGGPRLGDTWRWNGTAWTQSTPAASPPGRSSASMVYDSASQRIVLMCGHDGSGILSDQWEWDGTNWTAAATMPSGQRYQMMASFDSARQRVVAFGGYNYSVGYQGDTWERNNSAWSRVSDGNPLNRVAQGMAYDSQRGRTVLFGGRENSLLVYRGDTWEWDGAAWQLWSTSGPAARTRMAMAFDSFRGVTVLFGGYDGTNNFADTWEWNGTAWSQNAVTGPGARRTAAVAYDSTRHKVVLQGGFDGSYLNETWEYDGAWVYRGSSGPSARQAHAMAYDPVRQRTVLYGGGNGTAYLGDTWEWDGSTWVDLSSSVGPSNRAYHTMWYDAALQRIALFGGYDSAYRSDLWLWNGSSWALSNASPSAPSDRETTGTYDSARSRAVIFGGLDNANQTLGDTWEWSGAPAIGTHPQPRMVLTPASFQLTTAASGSPPLAFQWRRNGLALSNGGGLSGVTTATLTFNPALVAQSGTYDVVVSDACGTPTTSNPAPVTIWCMGDWNHDHAVTPADVAAYINDWSAATSSGSLGPDVDGSGAVNPSDVATFINNWFGQTGQAC